MHESRTQRTLLVGISLIGLLFLVQKAFDHYITSSTESRSWRIERDSITSVDELGRVARDLMEQRILVGDHIAETDAGAMARIEDRLMQVKEDLHLSILAYARLVELPAEAPLWNGARG